MTVSERIAMAIVASGRKYRDLSKEIGISVARISQLKSDPGSIRAENLFALARATGFSPQWIAEGIGDPRDATFQQGDCVVIPRYSVGVVIGNEVFSRGIELKDGLVFSRSWLRCMGLNEKSLKVLCAKGSSMSPTLIEGSVLLLDESQVEAQDRHLYAIQRPDGVLIIKRLVRAMTNDWIICSDNEDKRQYPDEVASDTEVRRLKIEGRIVWCGSVL
ncbi:S24 family peptidase [Pseudomonas protegens]|uniref:S24 family peptidase n=1 Tax=Pseudomonas protegens TaxID=380021 RepID=UPI002936F9EE|nr:S24 family peptidase [Pseudomonas protegens]WOE81569.1 S24 family peptidase [Pseudomonas protegens]